VREGGEILRKLAHVALALLFLAPYLSPELLRFMGGIDKIHFYMLLAALSASINSIQVKKPLFGRRILMELKTLRRMLVNEISDERWSGRIPLVERLRQLASMTDERMSDYEDKLLKYIESMERDYERRSGYIGVTFGAIGVAFSQLFFGDVTFYGILSLMIYDSVSALTTNLFDGPKIPYSHTSIIGALAASSLLAIVLVVFGIKPLEALIITLVCALTEAYFIEDNLALPIIVSLTGYLLGV